jgi:hypothetical protein
MAEKRRVIYRWAAELRRIVAEPVEAESLDLQPTSRCLREASNAIRCNGAALKKKLARLVDRQAAFCLHGDSWERGSGSTR